MPAPDAPSQLVIAGLSHDLVRKRTFVLINWPDDPEKRLSLPVPFACPLEAVPAEAEKALRALSEEIAAVPLAMAP